MLPSQAPFFAPRPRWRYCLLVCFVPHPATAGGMPAPECGPHAAPLCRHGSALSRLQQPFVAPRPQQPCVQCGGASAPRSLP
ncbi:MAG: hypothetical protein J3K34DRAFT_401336 [Monoraphidium minutum]|nr:MAG: hypothetical protein J3K34DRAFT_401336 [Monoraphidium minutum]